MPETNLLHIDSYYRLNFTRPSSASTIFARSGDILITDEFNRINGDYLSYLGTLKSLTLKRVFPAPRDVLVVSPKSDTGKTVADRILHDGETLQRLKNTIIYNNIGGLECFATTSEINPEDDSIARLAAELRVPLLSGPYEVIKSHGGKSGSRNLFRSLGLRVPSGLENITPQQIRDSWKYFHELPRGGFWIKADWGAREYGNIYVSTIYPDASMEKFDRLTKRYHGNFVVETHIQDAISFPAALVQIDQGGIKLVDIHEQSGVGISTYFKPDKMDRDRLNEHPFYGPPLWWPNIALREKFKQEAITVGKELNELGWIGIVCIDGIISYDNNIYWDEINFRKGGSSFVVEALRRINDVDDSVCLEEAGISFRILHMKTDNLSFSQLIKKLRRQLYLPQKKKGLLVLNAEYYSEEGFDLVAFGNNVEAAELDEMINRGIKAINSRFFLQAV